VVSEANRISGNLGTSRSMNLQYQSKLGITEPFHYVLFQVLKIFCHLFVRLIDTVE